MAPDAEGGQVKGSEFFFGGEVMTCFSLSLWLYKL